MNEALKYKMVWLVRVLFILVCFFEFQNRIIPVSASPNILYQNHHTGISEIYTYDKIESSVSLEDDSTVGLSRVLSKNKLGADGEVLGAVASVAAKGAPNVAKQAKSWLGKDYKVIANKAGDKIFMSKDGFRKMRFDIKKPSWRCSSHSFGNFQKWKVDRRYSR